jgi:hypothetical protein
MFTALIAASGYSAAIGTCSFAATIAAFSRSNSLGPGVAS